jgi:hypothetical protein
VEPTQTLTRKTWRHKPTGNFYAVELDDATIARAFGPLDNHDPDGIRAELIAGNATEADLDFIRANRAEFEELGDTQPRSTELDE